MSHPQRCQVASNYVEQCYILKTFSAIRIYPRTFISVLVIAILYNYVCNGISWKSHFTEVPKDLHKTIPRYSMELDAPCLPLGSSYTPRDTYRGEKKFQEK